MKTIAIAATLALAGSVALAPLTTSGAGHDPSGALQDAVTVEGIRAHQQAWQDIADANGGVRVAGSPGYDESADYVQALLEDAGYTVERPEFDFNFFELVGASTFEQTAPNPTTYVDQTDYDVMTFSGSGNPSATVTPVDLSLVDRDASTSGCEPEDFDGFPAGDIALVQRGACSFAAKATNAEAAGAVGVIVFNQGNTPDREGLLFGTLGGPGSNIPVLGTTFAVGEELAAAPSAASIDVGTVSETRTTTNVIATSQSGDPDTIVVAGAHLDSVPEGPGIQDNGSGSGAILEIALQMAEEFDVNGPGSSMTNAVRFAWWGAEEFGLLGSDNYVFGLPQEELDKIAVYLNFDMIGSPNFARFIYDGDGSAFGLAGPNGSAQIEQLFEDYFDDRGLANEPTQISFRSDYAAFFDSGIPFGGLFTGAEGLKTAEQVALYGGTEGEQYDQCYHQACDTFDNISLEALDQMSDAAAHAVATYAFSYLCNSIPATIVGDDGFDSIVGTNGDDSIVALGGNDVIRGMGGNDAICAGSGNDKVFGGSGHDFVDGGDDGDDLRGNAGNDIVLGGDGYDRVVGNNGHDVLDGGDGNDRIEAGNGDDVASGGDGNDRMFLGRGQDTADGGAGDDRIDGQVGDDVLDGGADTDVLRGGPGDDSCANGETVYTCEEVVAPSE